MGSCLLVFQQSKTQPFGQYLLQAAAALAIEPHLIHDWRQNLTDCNNYVGLILIGTPLSFNQDATHPFFHDGRRLLRTWLQLDRPCLGFHLGMHLIAEAAGAVVRPGFVRSVGFIDGHLTQEGRQHPLFNGLGSPLPLLKRHAQAIQMPLPRNLVLLATSRDCMVEACCLAGRPHIVGLQCGNHLAAPKDVAAWLARDQAMLAGGCKRRTKIQQLTATARQLAGETESTFSRILAIFFTLQ